MRMHHTLSARKQLGWRHRSRWIALWAGLTAVSLVNLSFAADGRDALGNGWVRHDVDGPHSRASVAHVVAGGPGFVAVGNGPTNDLLAWTSVDGQAWHRVAGDVRRYLLSLHLEDPIVSRLVLPAPPPTQGSIYAWRPIGPNGDDMAVGEIQPPGQPTARWLGAVWLSHRGGPWKLVSDKSTTFRGAEISDVARIGGRWIAVGETSPGPVGSKRPIVWTSSDAHHWRRVGNQPAFSPGSGMQQLVEGNGRLLAVGEVEAPDSRYGSITWTSADGITWNEMAGDQFRGGRLAGVSVYKSGYVAVGAWADEPALWSSPDGLTWTRGAGPLSFPGDNTRLSGVATKGQRIAVAGVYDTGNHTTFVPSAWVWTPSQSQLSPTPVPRSSRVDPKLFRVRPDDLPAGYLGMLFGWVDLCDDGAQQCNHVAQAVGTYQSYESQYVSNSPAIPPTVVDGMSIEGSHGRAGALKQLGVWLVRWWDRSGPVQELPPGVQIGKETQLFRWSGSPFLGPKSRSYLVTWHDGKAIGCVLVSRVNGKGQQAAERLAFNLAQAQWQHLKAAGG